MKYFVIFFILIGFVGFAHAEFDSSILGPFSDNDIVIVGTVVQITEDDNTTQYDIKIEELLKGQLSFDLITATLNQVKSSDFPQDPLDYYNKPFFEKDNQVLVYLRQDGATFEMSPYSFTIKKPTVAGPPTVIHATGPQHINSQGDEIIISGTIKKGYLYGLAKSDLNSDFVLVVLDENEKQIESKKLTVSPDGSYSFSFQDKGELRISGKYSWEITFENGGMGGTFFVMSNLDLWTPLKQFKSGVLIDEIQCKKDMVLLKKHDDSPACVKPYSVLELIKRNWLVTEGVDGYAIDYDVDVKHLPFADICTDEMKIFLLTYSNIASPDEKFVMADVALPSAMSQEDFARCADATSFTKSRWNMISMENPEPEPVNTDQQNLLDARDKLREAYYANVSLGLFNIKDVIVGYGIGDGFLVVDILEKYYFSDRKIIEEKIIDITGGNVDIGFIPSKAIIPTSVESVFPYVWNGFLHRNGIEFTPKEQSYANNDIGYDGIHRVCSPIIASNGTELYISSVFVYEPFEMTGTYIDKIKPDDCYKIWKTDTILVEPDLELGLWLENYWKNEN